MKFSTLLPTALLLIAAGVENVAANEVMTELMAEKIAVREKWKGLGVFKSKLYKRLATKQPCVNGVSGRGKNQEQYKCKNIDMRSFISHEDMGSVTREGNDVWGWTSAGGREFGIVGQTDG